MLRMSWLLILLRSTGVHTIIVIAVVGEGRLLLGVVLGSGCCGVIRGSVIIIVGTVRSAMRIRLIARCQKGNFPTSAATVQ